MSQPTAEAVLVTGGAGYVGSHAVRALCRSKRQVVILDDLSSGHREAVPTGVPFFQVDINDRATVLSVIRAHRIRAILHFASRIQVGESVGDPRKYWRENFVKSLDLIDAAVDAGVRLFVLSSSAAVYGEPQQQLIDESHPTNPINPYGETKLAIERALAGYHSAYGLRWVSLRYFNAAGAEPSEGLGERHDPETHLIPLAIAATARDRPLTVFGADFDTPDGTCIRDYVHVSDLADAHVATLGTSACGVINLGSGTGRSVREVIDAVERLSGRTVAHRIGARRPGDPPVLVASNELALRTLQWRPRRDFDTIIRDALAFHSRLPAAASPA